MLRIEFLKAVLRNILQEFQRRGPLNFRERKPYWVVLIEATHKDLNERLQLKYSLKRGGGERGLTVCVTTDKQKRVSVYTPASVLNST